MNNDSYQAEFLSRDWLIMTFHLSVQFDGLSNKSIRFPIGHNVSYGTAQCHAFPMPADFFKLGNA